MYQHLWKFTFLTLTLAGCAVLNNSEPRGDYVPITGLKCTSPEMVDGDMDTSDLVYIEGTMGVGEQSEGISTMALDAPGAHLVAPTTVQLPQPYQVGMIVLYGENLTNFKVLAKEGEDWKELRRFRNNNRKRVAVTTSVVTDTIRVIAIGYGLIRKGHRPEIQEIQIYGKP